MLVYCCGLIEAQGVFQPLEGNSTNWCIHNSSFLLAQHLHNAKHLLHIIPRGIVAYAFTFLRDNLCRNSCITKAAEIVESRIRKTPNIFPIQFRAGYKSSAIFRKCSRTFIWPSDKFWRIPEMFVFSGQKPLQNQQKCCYLRIYIIKKKVTRLLGDTKLRSLC